MPNATTANQSTTQIIACKVLHEELKPWLKPETSVTELEAGLHRTPERLQPTIQAAIDATPAHVQTIIVAYGLCSKAVVGLHSHTFTLIMPKIDDCLALILGSRKAYAAYLQANPGSYFLSKGWLKSGINLLDDYAEYVRLYGEAKAQRLHHKMFAHYQRLVFIESGQPASYVKEIEQAQKIAAFCDWQFTTLTGHSAFLQQMLTGPYDTERFVVVPPHSEVKLQDFIEM